MPDVDLTTLAVAIGRVEEKLSHISGLEDRLRSVEEAVTRMEAKERPKAPWYLIVGGLAGGAAAVAFVVDMLGQLLA
jgi:hypothetical protein